MDELIADIRRVYPGAESVRVEAGTVWVRCLPLAGRRDIPGGSVKLGTSPATLALKARALALVGADL